MSANHSTSDKREVLLKAGFVEWLNPDDYTLYYGHPKLAGHLYPWDLMQAEVIAEAIDTYAQALAEERVREARSKDPYKCEYGHEVYGHKTVDGWCCACDADQAFMEAEIENRIAAKKEGED
jgi:hypothetical protein